MKVVEGGKAQIVVLGVTVKVDGGIGKGKGREGGGVVIMGSVRVAGVWPAGRGKEKASVEQSRTSPPTDTPSILSSYHLILLTQHLKRHLIPLTTYREQRHITNNYYTDYSVQTYTN